MENYNLCIIKPSKSAFSETFIHEHISRLKGNKKVLYGGDFPLYDDDGNFLIRSKIGLISYLIQKRIFKKKDIPVRTKALIHYLVNEKIDVVLAEYGMVGAMVAEACKLANVPLIIHFHGADAHHVPTVQKYKEWYLHAFKYAAKIIGVSNDMINSLRKLGVPENKLVLNPYGINTERFCPGEMELGQNFTFLFVGRFVAKKFPQAIVRAFSAVSSHVPNAKLIMTGDGPLLEDTKALCRQLNLSDKITFTGVVSSNEISALMKQSSCYVQHSVTTPEGDMEGTPNTILEAAAVGMPIVSTKHAGIKEAVLDGCSGFLVDEYDVDEMAAKMIEVAGFSRPVLAEMGNAGREHILENYNISFQIHKLDLIIMNSIK
ncbi:glycosyltransferase family 4 protein [Pedobacter nyackensis]|uniref:glycosyltransferase family 4 protein n=1 Tax=Pedobacter nyackensis TaxID=475255 RepID=UPI00293046E0|nr:glycosyltransferase family 4 protein [Pedobacter nyackensis]